LLYAYRATVLNAIKEVEDALASLEQERQRHEQLKKAESADRLALALAQECYRNGLTAFLDVLIAQRALLARRLALIDSQAKLAGQRVALYKSLGGGWQVKESSFSPKGG